MTLLGKILVGVILVTGGYFLVKGISNNNATPIEETTAANTETESSTAAPVDNGAFSGSMTDLLARGGNYKCDFSEANDANTSTGTVYIAGKKMRGDFESTVKAANNMKIESHIISDGEFMYSWSSMMPMGIKMKVALNQNTNSTATPAASSGSNFDYNQKLNYKCSVWMEDSTVFTLPTGIKFTEAPQAS